MPWACAAPASVCVLIFANTEVPSRRAAVDAKVGANERQGPHQGAQKSRG
jgi:hypothetical protein